MNPQSRNPASASGTGLPQSMQLGEVQWTEVKPFGDQTQCWGTVRALEAQSVKRARAALAMRGADRFNALALASVYALAARDHAVMAGGAA